MMSSSKSTELNRFPKSFMRIIQFYRFFGFSFIESNNQKNKKFCSKLKEFLMIGYNISIIFCFISLNIYSVPITDQQLSKHEFKPLMKALFYATNILISVDLISGYILSLIRGKKLFMLMKTEDVCAIDINTKLAKILIISKVILFIVMMCISSSLIMNSLLNQNKEDYKVIYLFLLGFFVIPFYLNGVLIMTVIYIYSTWIITSQINNLKNNISRGNQNLKIYLNI